MARSATAHRTPRCRDIGVSFGCARGRASRSRCNFDIAAPSDRASDVCAAQASTDAQPHETSDAHCPPPRRGDAPASAGGRSTRPVVPEVLPQEEDARAARRRRAGGQRGPRARAAARDDLPAAQDEGAQPVRRTQEGQERRSGRDDAEGGGGGDADACMRRRGAGHRVGERRRCWWDCRPPWQAGTSHEVLYVLYYTLK